MRILGLIGLLMVSTVLSATELVYRFENPHFGGNPLNGTFLLQEASAQNGFKSSTSTAKTPIDSFKTSLQSAILNSVSRSSVKNLVDSDGNIVLGTNLNFDLDGDGQSDFSVVVDEITANGNVNINISDGLSNTVLTVPYSKATPEQ